MRISGCATSGFPTCACLLDIICDWPNQLFYLLKYSLSCVHIGLRGTLAQEPLQLVSHHNNTDLKLVARKRYSTCDGGTGRFNAMSVPLLTRR